MSPKKLILYPLNKSFYHGKNVSFHSEQTEYDGWMSLVGTEPMCGYLIWNIISYNLFCLYRS